MNPQQAIEKVRELTTMLSNDRQRHQQELAKFKDAGIPTLLFCPFCGTQHIDEGEWATKPHRTHECQTCKKTWRPYEVATYGMPYAIMRVERYDLMFPHAKSDTCGRCGGRRQSMDRELQLDQCECASGFQERRQERGVFTDHDAEIWRVFGPLNHKVTERNGRLLPACMPDPVLDHAGHEAPMLEPKPYDSMVRRCVTCASMT